MAEQSQPLKCRPEAWQALREQLDQLDSPHALLRGAVAISTHELQQASSTVVEEQFNDWANELLETLQSREPRALMAHGHELMFDELGFTGNSEDYDNPINSYIPVVMETKRGLPITLCLIYRELMTRLGLVVHGIGAPGHFLAGVELPEHEGLTYVDCFHGGGVLSLDEAIDMVQQVVEQPLPRTADSLPVVTPAEWLARLLRNLERAYERAERTDDAEAMREMRSLLEPEGS